MRRCWRFRGNRPPGTGIRFCRTGGRPLHSLHHGWPGAWKRCSMDGAPPGLPVSGPGPVPPRRLPGRNVRSPNPFLRVSGEGDAWCLSATPRGGSGQLLRDRQHKSVLQNTRSEAATRVSSGAGFHVRDWWWILLVPGRLRRRGPITLDPGVCAAVSRAFCGGRLLLGGGYATGPARTQIGFLPGSSRTEPARPWIMADYIIIPWKGILRRGRGPEPLWTEPARDPLEMGSRCDRSSARKG